VCRVVVVDKRDLIGRCGDDGVRAGLDYGEIAKGGYPTDAAELYFVQLALIEIVDVVLGSDKIPLKNEGILARGVRNPKRCRMF
jgi:hypothetical protein